MRKRMRKISWLAVICCGAFFFLLRHASDLKEQHQHGK